MVMGNEAHGMPNISSIPSIPSILVVDDSVDSLRVLTQMLREEPYEIRPVLTGEQALNAALSSPPDLILLDIMMPDMDGYEVCRRLKADPVTRQIPVIFLTSLNDDSFETKGLALGAVDFISKPIRSEIVKARVNTHILLKQQKDELEKQSEELKLAYSELEAFTYSVTHDLKAPLQTIQTFSSFVLENLERHHDSQGIEDITVIQTACRQMIQLIHDLLQMSKASANDMCYTDMNLSEMAECIMSNLQRNNLGRVVDFICEERVHARADMNLLNIALTNLLSNAWKYSKKTPNSIIEFGTHSNNDGISYFIRDNGVGFDMEKAADIFKPFVRLHRDEDYEGTGIGLATVNRIINRHNGAIWAESESGHGTTIRFTLGTACRNGDIYDR